MNNLHPAIMTDLDSWIAMLDALPLECDGLARVASLLLQREAVEHTVHAGSVTVENAGRIWPHFWIEMADGRVLDLRARMWLADKEGVPHGVFTPEPYQQYLSEGTLDTSAEHPLVFLILAGKPIEEFPYGLREALAAAPSRARRAGPA